jgi:hypothetical protein
MFRRLLESNLPDGLGAMETQMLPASFLTTSSKSKHSDTFLFSNDPSSNNIHSSSHSSPPHFSSFSTPSATTSKKIALASVDSLQRSFGKWKGARESIKNDLEILKEAEKTPNTEPDSATQAAAQRLVDRDKLEKRFFLFRKNLDFAIRKAEEAVIAKDGEMVDGM